MNDFFELDDNRRRLVIDQTAVRIGLPEQAVEKDLWVTTMLQVVFSMPYADKILFKGGSSLAKIGHLISRMSEDIDLAFDRSLFGITGDIGSKQLKKLRKGSSTFVRDNFAPMFETLVASYGLDKFCSVRVEPDGEGDATYPEPRKVFIAYKSVYPDKLPYLLPEVVLEVGARSLFEPTEKARVTSIIHDTLGIVTDIEDVEITAATPGKTFLEKAFLLHEIFSTGNCANAARRTRHMYDLEKMMDLPLADVAVRDNHLWETIRHHRETFTHIRDVDYTPDVRSRLRLTPPDEFLPEWRRDYQAMTEAMMYGEKPEFDVLLERMKELEQRFKIQAAIELTKG